jgi:dUTP pyrophosphatase
MDINIWPRSAAYVPTQNKPTDAGYDLSACIEDALTIQELEEFNYNAEQGYKTFYFNGKKHNVDETQSHPSVLKEPAVIVRPGEVKIVSAGFKIALPPAPEGFNNVMQVYPRSGLGINARLILANSVGIIDQNYIEYEVKIALNNVLEVAHIITDKARVAQALFTTVARANFSIPTEWDISGDRGGGIGSSGVAQLANSK